MFSMFCLFVFFSSSMSTTFVSFLLLWFLITSIDTLFFVVVVVVFLMSFCRSATIISLLYLRVSICRYQFIVS